MADAPLLKDFVDRDSITSIGNAIRAVVAGFDVDAFVSSVFDGDWEGKALKQRIRHVANMLRDSIDGDYSHALDVLRRSAHAGSIEGFAAWCLNDFVEEYGVEEPDLSLPALEEFTKLASSEFAVRPFITRYPERMAEQMLEWARNGDEAVRRLASEGYRPRLPWGMGIPALKKDPSPILPILELLHSDSSETVRRSVANNLNDISKDHPEVAIGLLKRWGDDSPEAEALRKHALRTLLKAGDPAALELLGYAHGADVAVTEMTVSPDTVRVGEHTFVEFTVASNADTSHPVMVDYAVTFQNKSGTGSRKVFKGKTEELAPGDRLHFRRKVSLQPMSTREIFPGTHTVEAQVNGVVRATRTFEVID